MIFHFDLDSFFVAAERLRNPKLVGAVMAVGGIGPRAVISSASYEARRFGVRSAMPTAQAMRLCPGLVMVDHDLEYYSRLSKEVFAVVSTFSPVWEATGIDEGFIDMTGTTALHGKPREAAAKLKHAVRGRTGLAVSVGIATNRLVAKIATDAGKPDGIFLVEPGREAEFLAPRPVKVIPGVGRVTEDWLRSRGIQLISELRKFPPEALERHLGSNGRWLSEAAWGRGGTEFNRAAKSPSISRERTFGEDVGDSEFLKQQLWKMAAELGAELRESGERARVVRLKLRYPPFETITRSRTLAAPTQRDEDLFAVAHDLLGANWERGKPVRLSGISCALGDAPEQFDLFEQPRPENRAKMERLDALKDELRAKFGDQAILTGRDMGSTLVKPATPASRAPRSPASPSTRKRP